MSAVEVEQQAPAERRSAPATRRLSRRSHRTILWPPLGTLIVGLVITGILTALSRDVYVHNEHRLLRLRVRDATSLITTVLPSVQTPLASAAELSDATGGSAARFRAFANNYVGPRREFVSMSLWDLRHPNRGPLAVVGTPPALAAASAAARAAFLARIERSPTLSVLGLLTGSSPRLGYGYSIPNLPTRFAAYGEAAVARNRYQPVGPGSPFTGLKYTLYLNRVAPQNLLATNVRRLPLSGDVSTQRVAFGDSAFVLSMSSPGPLSGTLPRALPWIILIGGALLSLTAAGGVLRLSQRRRNAEELALELRTVARENRRLYAEQRTIAQTLQHALLPDRLPQVDGIETAGRYEAGEQDIDIGGDWYDVLALEGRRLLLVVGDVSGRGLRAATTMASLRFAIHAYAAQHDPPERILSKISGLISIAREGQLATVLCAQIDIDRHEVSIASAGHLPLLLMAEGESRYLQVPAGLPTGIDGGARYRAATFSVPARATLVGFTDGLVERRGEHLDQGLDRLRDAAAHPQVALPALLSNLVADLSGGGAKDDIAIVGVRWTI